MIALSHPAFASVKPQAGPLWPPADPGGVAERRRQRRALLALNDHALKDIGLSSADAWQEGHKPFWRT